MDGTGLETKQVLDADNIVGLEVEGISMTDEDGGVKIRTKDILRITPVAANSIIIKSSRKW